MSPQLGTRNCLPPRPQAGISGIPLRIHPHLGRADHSAHAQHPAGVVCVLLLPDGRCHHRVHRAGTRGDHTPDCASVAANARHDGHAAPGPRNPATLRGRPSANLPGDHAALPRKRGEPNRLSGPVDSADAHPDRFVPGPDPYAVQQPGRLGEAFGQAVFLDHLRPDPFGGAGQQHLPLARPQSAGPVAHSYAHFGRCDHLGAAENDADAVSGPASAVQPNDDVVDDAHFPWSILPGLAQRTAPLLGGFQPHRHHDPVFHHRLGAVVPAVPTTGAGRGRSRAVSPGSRTAGE